MSFSLVFKDNEQRELEVFATVDNTLRVVISDNCLAWYELNKSDAIKLVKELKKQIGSLSWEDENEG